jgi:hypothetical protein
MNNRMINHNKLISEISSNNRGWLHNVYPEVSSLELDFRSNSYNKIQKNILG